MRRNTLTVVLQLVAILQSHATLRSLSQFPRSHPDTRQVTRSHPDINHVTRIQGSDPPRRSPRYSLDLDATGDFRLRWDFESDTKVVTFIFDAKTANDFSWVAVGFSDYGEVQDADFAILWTDSQGESHFKDAHTDREGVLSIDEQQDYTLNAAKITQHHVIIKFTRDFDTCDEEDYAIDSGTTHVLYATGRGPLHGLAGTNMSDVEVGLQRVQLLKSQLSDPPYPPDTKIFTMRVTDVPIPAEETTYWCSVHKLPPFKEKHHIIRFEGDISEGGQGIVHHLEVFHCEVPVGVKVRPYNAPCKSMAERPAGLESCFKVIGAWAMGASGISYPQQAGYPIGGPDFSRYVMLEVHYNNPDKIQGHVDSSGIKFFVTSSLREHDAGIMELGMEYSDKYALPPGQDRWPLSGYCVPQCTEVGLPPGGIYVFASQLHTHATGKAVYTEHFRDGVQLPDMNRDDHYSPHYQEIRKLPQQVHVAQGDFLITTCEDSTIDKTNITMGGFSISDEMCVNYIHYYPRAELEVCKSAPTAHALYRFFEFLREYEDEDTSPDKGISDNYKSIHWNRLNLDLLAQFYREGPLSMQCNQSDGSRFPGDWEGLAIPRVVTTLPEPPDACDETEPHQDLTTGGKT